MADLTDPRAARSRAALLTVAATMLMSAPSAAPSVTEVAAQAGVSRPTFYQHFADVPALMAAAVTAELEQAFAQSDAALASADGVDFLRGTNQMLVMHVYERRAMYREILRGPASYEVLNAAIGYISMRMRSKVIGARIGGAHDESGMDRIDATAAGAVWLVTRWLDTDLPLDHSPESFAERLTQLMLGLIELSGPHTDSPATLLPTPKA